MSQYLGDISAYALAVSQGYTGTEEEYAELMASYATVGQTAVTAAQTATTKASEAATSATTATNKASEATTAATTATNKAGEASTSASTATSAKDTAVSAASTATTKATEATTAAATATSAKTDAVAANTAAQSAKTAAQTAQTGAETAAASVEASSAQIATNAEDISQLKSDFASLTQETVLHSDQLIDVDAGVTGVVDTNGTITTVGAWANYKTSDYIPVEAGKTYTFYLIKADGTQPSAAYRLIYGLYDSSKAFRTHFNTDYLNSTAITPSVDGFVRVSCGDVASQQYAFSQMAMLVEGTVLKPYEEYYAETIVKLSNDVLLNTAHKAQAADSAINAMTSDVSHLGTVAITPEWTPGYKNKSGVTGASNNYAYTQIFDVKSGDIVELWDETNEEYCNFRYITAYSNGTAVSASGQEGGYSYTVPSGIDQICITALTVMDLDNSIIYNHGTITEKKIKKSYLPSTGNVLYGKKWAVCGDSFTAYTNKKMENGDYVGKMRTYPFLIGSRNMMQIDDRFMSSGRTLAYPADGTFTNSLTCPTNAGYYQNIPADADYITIMLGINDSQHIGSGSTGDGEDATGVITLGTINDESTATYYGAWNVVLGWIRENRPFAHVGIVISNGIEVQEWVEAIENVAKKWGFPTLNLNGDDRCPVMIRAYNPNVPAAIKQTIKEKQAVDYNGTTTESVNTHPNWQTHELESTIFEAWLRSL